MTVESIQTLLIGLGCAALYILLFQYLFPRRVPWMMVAAALISGIAVTYLLTVILKHTVEPGLSAVKQLVTFSDALSMAVLRAALPEEATKAIATLLALLPFWRRATPAQAFQAALVVALGFSLVENRGYVAAFESVGLLIAVGRGLFASFIHATVAMVFGAFLMRFVAGGWRSWHLVILGYLTASLCHALHDAGLLLPAAEFLRTGSVEPETMLGAAPMVVAGFGSLLVGGLWSLRRAIGRAAEQDPITAEPHHQRSVRRWRRAGNLLLALALVGIAGNIAVVFIAETTPAPPPDALRMAVIWIGSIVGALFLVLLGWVLRQKR